MYLAHQLVALAARGIHLRHEQAKDDADGGEVGAERFVHGWQNNRRAGEAKRDQHASQARGEQK